MGSMVLARPSPITGRSAVSNLRSRGRLASSGRSSSSENSRSRTSLAAASMSTPQPKRRVTSAVPSTEVDSISSSPGVAATACSTGRVTSSSMVSGAAFS